MPDRAEVLPLPPEDVAALRRSLLDAVGEDEWEAARTGFGDLDLATE